MTLRDHRVFNRGRQTQSDTKMEQVKDNIQGLFEKNVFDTAVVAEFISDPEEFLATTVEIDESIRQSVTNEMAEHEVHFRARY